MKNSEWEAAAYLSHSKYGVNENIYINNSENYYTGRSAGTTSSDNTSISSDGTYTWDGKDTSNGNYASDRTLGTKASTTGNITGIYDMSGGAHDRVMGNYNDTIGNAGFSAMPDGKYYDKYTESINDSCTIESCGGHALYETYYWYRAPVFHIDSRYPWLMRGGSYNDIYASTFRYLLRAGYAERECTFRSVISYIA